MTEKFDSKSLSGAFKDKAPKPNVHIEVERGAPIKGDCEPNQLVKRAGRMLTPDSMEYVASYCVHAYRYKMSLNIAFANQVLNEDDLDPTLKLDATRANLAIQDLGQAVAKTFGWTPDKRTKKMVKER